MKRRLPSFAVSCTFALAAGLCAHAQTAIDRAREGEARQGQIQADSQNLVGQLDAMMDEYERNALSGEEIKTFKALRGLLSRLSGEEMEKIRAVLKEGVAQNDPQAAIKAIADAYAAQKGVLGEFKRVLAEHERNQEALRLSRQVSDLADRQAANLQTGITMAQWSLANRAPKAEMDASLSGQAAEQKAIADDLKLLREQLQTFAKNGENKDAVERINKGLEQGAQAAPQLDAALKALGDKQVFNAVTAQKAARDAMRQMARTIAPPKDEAEMLRQAAEQVDKLLSQQREALVAAVAAKPKSLPEWVAEGMQDPKSPLMREVAWRKLPADPAKLMQDRGVQAKYSEQRRQKEAELAALESKQGDLMNQTEALSQDLANVAKPAADALQAALPKMQEARAAASAKAAAPAAQALAESVGALAKAKADLSQRLANAEQAKDNGANPLAALQNLQKQTQDLMKQEQALAQNGGAPLAPGEGAKAGQQAALQQKAQQMQKQAAANAPAAAPALAKAAANMQQAAAAMNNPAQAAAAAPAQQQAMQNLAQADKQLAQQIAQAQQQVLQAQAGAAALQEEVKALAKIIVEQQQVGIETAAGAAKPEKTARPLLLALAPRQESIRRQTDGLKNPAAGTAPADPKILGSALGHMDSAKAALERADGRGADPEEQAALKDLYALQDKAQARLAAAQAPPGAPPAADPQAAAAAAAALAKAQAQVAQAAAALAAAAPPPPAAGQPAGAQPPGAAPAGAPPAGQQAGAPPAGAKTAGAPAPPAPGAPAGAAPAPGAPASGPPSPAMAKAALQLNLAASAVGAAAAQAGAAPQGAKDAMRQAAAALAAAAAEAGGNQGAQAQADTAQAQQAMAQAQAALAQSQAGIAAAGGPPGSPTPGAGAPGAPGPAQPGTPAPGGPPAGGPPGPAGSGSGEGNWQAGGATVAPPPGLVGGRGQFVGLPERDRATVRQAQSEKYPQQYAADVEQYLRNLSDESTPR